MAKVKLRVDLVIDEKDLQVLAWAARDYFRDDATKSWKKAEYQMGARLGVKRAVNELLSTQNLYSGQPVIIAQEDETC